jgi:CRP-like cAMP-binding protein
MIKSLASLMENPAFPEGTCWHRESHPARKTIFESGQNGDQVYLLLEGSVRVMGEVEVFRDQTAKLRLHTLHAGDVFGELCLFDGHARSAAVVVCEDAQVAAFSRRCLLAYCEANPTLGYALIMELMRALARRMRRNNQHMLNLMADSLRSQVDRYQADALPADRRGQEWHPGPATSE